LRGAQALLSAAWATAACARELAHDELNSRCL
jgi:hypothetical protein